MPEKEQLEGLVEDALRASSKNLRIPSEESKCLDVLKQIKGLSLSRVSIRNSESICKLQLLTSHRNPRIKSEAKSLFDIWSRTLYGREKKTCCVTDENLLKFLVKEPSNPKPAAASVAPVKSGSLGKFESSSKVGDTDTKSCAVRCKAPVKLGNIKSQLRRRNLIPRASSEKSRRTSCSSKSMTVADETSSSRSKIREFLSKRLAMVADEVPEKVKQRLIGRDPVNVAAAVESAMFQKFGSFNGPKKTKYRSIMFNIGDTNNKDLRRKVMLGEIKPEKLVELNGEELGSDKRQAEIRQLRQKAADRENASVNRR